MPAASLIAALEAALLWNPTSAPPVPPQTMVRLSVPEMFGLAERLQGEGRIEQAKTVLRALEGNPVAKVGAEARFRIALLLKGQGRDRDAAVELRRLVDERPDSQLARLELAGLLAKLGDEDAAGRELRALQAGSLPPHVARLVDRFSDALRARRSHGASLELAIAPDSNINRATRRDTLGTVLGDFELNEDAKARSGLGFALRGQAFQRLLHDGELPLLVRLSATAELYGQTAFNTYALDIAAGPELRIGRGRLQAEAGAGQRWLGSGPYLRYLRIGATGTRPIGSRAQARLQASAIWQDNRLNDLQDGRGLSMSGSLERALGERTGLIVRGGIDRFDARDPAYSSLGWRVGLGGWRELGRTTLFANADLGQSRYDDRLLLLPEPRADRFGSISLGATMRQFRVRGFAPLVRVTVEHNRSNISIYDYRRVRTEVGIARAF